jgi:RNA polymerase sigma factor (sigma-70 family)
MDDHELLREYVQNQSQEAFRQLVDRHLGMVLSAARRMAGDAHLAEEVAQGVFTALAQKSATLGASVVVGGWLYNTTRHMAMHVVRAEQRRRQREETAAAMQALETDDGSERILEHLETAMAQLGEEERDTLVLRYFEDRSLREVGRELSISEDAARMRVNRALERLRTIFAGQGITVSSVLLGTVLSASTIAAVPAGLASTITATALVGTAVAAAVATQATLTTMFKAKAAAAILGAVIITGTGTYLVQQRQLERLRAENQNLLAQQQQLTAEQEAASKAVQTAREELERLQKDNAELLRLRNEVGQLRREREAAKQRASQPAALPAGTGQSAANPGRYISKDQLAFAGYATPEAALESMTWAMMKGTYEQAVASLGPELQQGELNDAKGREQFENGRKASALHFIGMQIVARKTLAEDRVELKVKMDADPMPNSGAKTPPFFIQPMVRVGTEWKLGGSTRGYRDTWDQDGPIQAYTQ